jgi:hypothetical protein
MASQIGGPDDACRLCHRVGSFATLTPPTALRFDAAGRFAFVYTARALTGLRPDDIQATQALQIFAMDGEHGTAALRATLPTNEATTYEWRFDPSARFAYSSRFRENSLSGYRIEADGAKIEPFDTTAVGDPIVVISQ